LDTGDVVLHKPSGEHWVVAYVDGDKLSWCGWPEGLARVTDFELVRAAQPDARLKLLHQMASMSGSDSRKTYAQARLAQAEAVLPSEY
jgi:hypothetical protein